MYVYVPDISIQTFAFLPFVNMFAAEAAADVDGVAQEAGRVPVARLRHVGDPAHALGTHHLKTV